MTSQCHHNKTHSWYAELSSLQKIYLGFVIFYKLAELCQKEMYLWNDRRTCSSSVTTADTVEFISIDDIRVTMPCGKSRNFETLELLLLLLQLFYDPLSGTTRVSQCQKDKPFWILLKQRRWGGSGISWTICKLFALCSRR